MKIWRGLLLAMTVLALAGCAGQASEMDVEMKEFGFTPQQMRVKAGAPVTLHIRNDGALEHDLVILNRGETAAAPFHPTPAQVYWQTQLDARQEQTLQFTAPAEPGEYSVVCDVAGHLEQGMRATLIVEP